MVWRLILVVVLLIALVAGAMRFLMVDSVEPEVGRPAEQTAARPEPVADPARVAEPAPRRESVVTPAPVTPQAAEPDAAGASPDRTALTGVLVGRILDPRGARLEGGTVQCANRPGEARSDVQGEFRLAVKLRPGRVEERLRFEFRHPRYGGRNVAVRMEAGQETSVGDVRLRHTAMVSGQVLDALRRPVPGAEVIIAPASDDHARHGSARHIGPQESLVRDLADPGGRFEIVVPADDIRVWARAEGYLWGRSESVGLGPDQRRDGLVLVLDSAEHAQVLTVRVRDGNDAPVAGASVTAKFKAPGNSSTVQTQADANGELTLYQDQPGHYWIAAADPAGRLGTAIAHSVPSEQRELILRLESAQPILLHVSGTGPRPVSDPWLRLVEADGDRALPTEFLPGDAENSFSYPAPPTNYLIQVQSTGFKDAEFGPLSPDDRGPLEVTLEPLPLLQGQVLAQGEGLAGAHVSLHLTVDDQEQLTVNGFPARMHPSGKSSATTGAEGHFEMAVPEAGRYFVRAVASGFAPADLGPLNLDPRALPEVKLELSEGGTIEGWVRSSTVDVERCIVGASRGDGFGFSHRPDAQGKFRLERLTPGPWHLTLRNDEILSGQTNTSRTSGAARPLPSNCLVREGQVTSFILDLDQMYPCPLEGRLQLGDQDLSRWQVQISSQGAGSVDRHATLEPDGTFHFALPDEGTYRLVFHARRSMTRQQERPERWIFTDVEIHRGPNTWKRRLDLGAIQGSFDEAAVPAGHELRFDWSDGELHWTSQLLTEGRDFRAPGVPVGEGQVVREGPDGRQTWPVTVSSGKETTLVIPPSAP